MSSDDIRSRSGGLPLAPWGKKLRRRERAEALAMIEEQIKAGTLVIRQATAEERKRYGIPSVFNGESDR